MLRLRLALPSVFLALLGACHPAQVPKPRPAAPTAAPAPAPPVFFRFISARASTDLSCPAASVKVRVLHEQTWAATGCGQQATYNCFCTRSVARECRDGVCSLGLVAPSP